MGLCTALTCHVEGHVFTQKISDHLMGSAVALILESDPSQRNEMFGLGTCPFCSSSSQSEKTTRCRREPPRKDRAKRVHTTVQTGSRALGGFPSPSSQFLVPSSTWLSCDLRLFVTSRNILAATTCYDYDTTVVRLKFKSL